MDIYGYLLCSLPLLLCIHFYLNKFNGLPPGPTGLPILGNLLTIGNRPYESLARLAETYGPIMTVKFGLLNVVIISSAEMAKEILQKYDQAFIGRPTPESVAAGKYYDMSMVWSSGQSPHWKKLRRICNSHLFTNQRLDALQELRHQMMRRMIEQVNEAHEAREAVHVGRLVFATSLNFLSNTIFSGDMFDMKSEALGELKELLGDLMELAVKANVADFWPFLRPFDPQGIRRGITVLYDRVHELLDGIIGKRIKQRESDGSERCGDFLNVLLDLSEEHGDKELSYLNIKILFMDLFVAGTHTTTATLEWAMAELLRHPPILAKAKQELSAKIQPRQIIQEQDIPHFPYLDSIIKEAMRLHPAAPLLLPHLTEQQVKIHGYTIPKNTQVFVNIWSIMRDPANWDDPTRFNPERFMDSGIDIRGRDCTFMPFGTGRRICPGSNLAMRMVSLMLANLVHGYDWEMANGLKAEDMDMTGGVGIALVKHVPLVAIPL